MIGLCSWGEKAHRKINSSIVEFFPKELNQLKAWEPILAAHCSDADLRKRKDKPEFVKHFIDIDNYDDFINKHEIEENFEMACQKYGKEMVKKEGTLPWTTDSTYLALVQDFKSGNWNRAALTAADLGHYVGDGHMPLHITANYDGQKSNQTGIHRRYEETMIDRHVDKIQFEFSKCKKVKDVRHFIFSYLYTNHFSIVPLLKADSLSFALAGKQYDEMYYTSLWENSNSFTVRLLEESSKKTASLIYSAWIEAGKPKIQRIPEKQIGN
jgi:hypothetical protein